MPKPKLAVIIYPRAEKAKCAICGEEVEFAAGPALHTTSTWRPVCHRCGNAINPELTQLVTPRFIDLHGFPHLFMGGKLYALDVQDESSHDVENEAFEEYLDEIRDSADSEVKH
jgi:hypothetical protein